MATQSEREQNFGDPTGGSTAYLAIVGVLIFVLVIVYLEALYYSSAEEQREQKVVQADLAKLKRVREDQNDALIEPRYDHAFNDSDGRVTIPIEEARRKLLEEWPNVRLGWTQKAPAATDSESGGDAN